MSRLELAVETERLRLRRLNGADAQFLLELLNQPGWLEFIGDRNVRTLAQACDYLAQRIDAQFDRYGYGMWGIELGPHRRSAIGPPAMEPPGMQPPGMEPPGMQPPGMEPPGMEPPVMGQLVGLAGLVKRDSLPEPDLGFALLDRYAGRGLAFEAASAVLPWARARGLKRLLAITHPDNRRSIELLRRLGFALEGAQTAAGNGAPVLCYSISWAE